MCRTGLHACVPDARQAHEAHAGHALAKKEAWVHWILHLQLFTVQAASARAARMLGVL